MPLVVPGIMSNNGGDDWTSKLSGKKIGDSHNETTFAKTDLPKEHRILEPGSMKTMDYKPNRLNIHVGEDGTVQSTSQG